MMNIARMIMFLFCFCSAWAAAEDSTDANFGQIKKIDLSDDRPSSPNHILLALKLNKVKPGQLGQVTLYQFAKRSRIDFDADLPAGEYSLYAANECQSSHKSWTLLHRFKSTGTHVQTEKSLPKASLSEAKPGHLVLNGKALILTRTKPPVTIDCEIIK